MTIIEFFERELQKCRNNLEHQMKHNAPASDIENLKNKVMYYETICKMLKGDGVESKWESRTGERWIGSEVCEHYTYYSCNKCGRKHDRSDSYCPHCGTKMKGGGE